MKITKSFAWLAPIALCAVLVPLTANSAIIFTENFNTDGLGTRYSAAGAGGAGLGCCQNWSLNSQDEGNETDVLVGFEGADFWSGSDLDDGNLPSGFSSTNPRDLIMNTVDISLFSNEQLTVSLASNALDIGEDFLRVLAINSDTGDRTVLDFFDGSSAGSVSGVILGSTFQDISYDLSGLGYANLDIAFEAWSTSNSDVIGIDNIVLSGTSTNTVPVPETIWLYGLGLIGLIGARKKSVSLIGK